MNVIGDSFSIKERRTYWNTMVSLKELSNYKGNQTKCTDKETYNYILREYVGHG